MLLLLKAPGKKRNATNSDGESLQSEYIMMGFFKKKHTIGFHYNIVINGYVT